MWLLACVTHSQCRILSVVPDLLLVAQLFFVVYFSILSVTFLFLFSFSDLFVLEWDYMCLLLLFSTLGLCEYLESLGKHEK